MQANLTRHFLAPKKHFLWNNDVLFYNLMKLIYGW